MYLHFTENTNALLLLKETLALKLECRIFLKVYFNSLSKKFFLIKVKQYLRFIYYKVNKQS
jgi:hypothetical protein